MTMEALKFTSKNHITIPGFAVAELKLAGNELVCFSLIYGFCQDGESEFYGSLSYLSSATNMTIRGVQNVLRSLREKGLLNKRDEIVDNVKYCRYSINREVWKIIPIGIEKFSKGYGKNKTEGMENFAGGYGKTCTEGMEKFSNNNIKDNIHDNIKDIPADDPLEGRWVKFQKWITANCPEVQKMKYPITRDQFATIVSKFPNDIIISTLQEMNNWAQLRKRNISAYQTLTTWINRRKNEQRIQSATGRTAGNRADATLGTNFRPSDI